ncbi:hypothetical protein CLF_110397 [Clonorchis sinensis]|uniref:Uncharacterized protein n=1 Tax=Clonorchis sinensis TaxID=79923 RepID=G7YKM7_CLOSI|nr:hypothetical protein CLF_110397 [Clonorchis sinensis]
MPIQYLRRSTIAQQYRSELAQQLSTCTGSANVDEAWQNVKEAMLAAFSAVCPTSPIRPQNHWISARSLSMIDARKSIPAGNARMGTTSQSPLIIFKLSKFLYDRLPVNRWLTKEEMGICRALLQYECQGVKGDSPWPMNSPRSSALRTCSTPGGCVDHPCWVNDGRDALSADFCHERFDSANAVVTRMTTKVRKKGDCGQTSHIQLAKSENCWLASRCSPLRKPASWEHHQKHYPVLPPSAQSITEAPFRPNRAKMPKKPNRRKIAH